MRYIEFKITVDREMLETAESVLLEHGYDSMQMCRKYWIIRTCTNMTI